MLLKVLVMIQASQNIENNCNIMCCQHLQYKTLRLSHTLFKKEHFAPQQPIAVLDHKALKVLICSDSRPFCLIFSHGLEQNINVTHLSEVIFISSTFYFGV